jgi:hypothetical protein
MSRKRALTLKDRRAGLSPVVMISLTRPDWEVPQYIHLRSVISTKRVKRLIRAKRTAECPVGLQDEAPAILLSTMPADNLIRLTPFAYGGFRG